MAILTFLFGIVVTLFPLCVITHRKDTQPKNNVHFYVARDKDGELYLYLGKPLRDYDEFIGDLTKGSIVLTGYHFNKFVLNKNDYAKLKWEDEPVEVFLNLED